MCRSMGIVMKIKNFWQQSKADDKMRKVMILIVICLCSLFLEIFVFNFRHWASVNNEVVSINPTRLGTGYIDNGNGTYTIGEGNLDISLENIDRILSNACIDINILNLNENENVSITVWQSVTDESHKMYYGLPEREIWTNEARSTYMTYHLYGKCTALNVVPVLNIGRIVSFEIKLNPVIPIFFSWERVLAVFLSLIFVYLLRPASALHKITYNSLNYRNKNFLIVIFFVFQAFVCWKMTTINPVFQWERGDNQQQYQKLTEAFVEGSFSLLDEPTESLKQMENPYDYDYRQIVMSESGEWYKWDHAYYEGKYYVYFGVVPVVLFYLPVYLITGAHLANHTMVFITSLLFLLGLIGVFDELIKKWFHKISVAVWFLLMELVIAGSGVIYITKRPDLYTVPIFLGLAFGLLGFWCFLKAGQEEKVSSRHIVWGSLFTALIAGCRPQLFVFVSFFIILFACKLFDVKQRNKAEIKEIAISFLMPMIMVAVLLMLYNYIRFGSVLDFGANYNLTFNDMRRRGWVWDRLSLGILAYLWQPLKTTLKYPFVEAIYFNTQYMGITILEATYGGVFMVCPFAWFSFLPFFFKKQLREKKKVPWWLAICSFAMAIIIVVVDTEMSGILMRYFGDFRLFIMLASAISVCMICEHKKVRGSVLERAVIWMLIICLFVEVGYQGMTFFLDTGESLRECRTDLYSHYKSIIAFWM